MVYKSVKVGEGRPESSIKLLAERCFIVKIRRFPVCIGVIIKFERVFLIERRVLVLWLSCSNDKSIHVGLGKIVFSTWWSWHLNIFPLLLFFFFRWWWWKSLVIVSWMLWGIIIIDWETTTHLNIFVSILSVNTAHLLLPFLLIEWWIDLVRHGHSIILLVYLINNFARYGRLPVFIFVPLRLIISLLVLFIVLFLELTLVGKDRYETEAEGGFNHWAVDEEQTQEKTLDVALFRSVDKA